MPKRANQVLIRIFERHKRSDLNVVFRVFENDKCWTLFTAFVCFE